MKKFIIALCLVLPLSSYANVKTYQIDTPHSIVSFKIGHLIGKVQGSFSQFSGELKHDEDNIKKFSTNVSIQVDSIHTNNEKRDEHLKSADFFDVNNKEHSEYNTITFDAKNFQLKEKIGDTYNGTLNGYITIHGVKKPISLETVIHGTPMLDPFGNARISLSATGSLNRKDFGLTWSHPAGELVVGDVVEIEVEIQAAKKVKAPKKTEVKNKDEEKETTSNKQKKGKTNE